MSRAVDVWAGECPGLILEVVNVRGGECPG